MNLLDVMEEIAARLDTITGLRVFGYPEKAFHPPAAVVSYPESYIFDATYGRGMDRIEDLPVVVVVGDVHARGTRAELAPYADGSGAQSVKAVLEAAPHTAFDTLRVTEVIFDVYTIGDIDHMAAVFTCDIAGQGSA